MPPAPPVEMLAEMSACAHRLGMAFGAEAERETDRARKIEAFNLFDRCFFSVRVAIALRLRLERGPVAAAQREALSDADDLRDREERPETDRPDRDRRDRDRLDADRETETERASLPILLKTLRGVAADASALPGPAPAELSTLRDLLARPTQATPPARPQASGLRTRLAGSATAAVTTPAPARPTTRLPLRPRAATGPPRR